MTNKLVSGGSPTGRLDALSTNARASLEAAWKANSFQGSVFGTTFFVDSGATNAGDTARHGLSPAFPFATIDYAIGQCTANQGDVILVSPGHTEVITAAGGITCDVAGIKIVGVGYGSLMPKITFTTATTATFLISANNVWVEGLWFECDKTGADVEDLVRLTTAAYCTIKNCYFTEGTADEQALQYITLDHADADWCTIEGCQIVSETAGATAGIAIDAAVTGTRIINCDIQGDYSDSCIHSGSAHLNCTIVNNILRNDGAADHAIEFTAAATGMIAYNSVGTATTAGGAATVLDIGSCKAVENYAADADADTSGVLTPPATA